MKNKKLSTENMTVGVELFVSKLKLEHDPAVLRLEDYLPSIRGGLHE